ncbi:MAG: hypothetical protein ACRENZ_02305 [Thermodesulfobacteriota bacterium]
MRKKKKPTTRSEQGRTTDAVEILHRRYFEGRPERLALLEEERTNAVKIIGSVLNFIPM